MAVPEMASARWGQLTPLGSFPALVVVALLQLGGKAIFGVYRP